MFLLLSFNTLPALAPRAWPSPPALFALVPRSPCCVFNALLLPSIHTFLVLSLGVFCCSCSTRSLLSLRALGACADARADARADPITDGAGNSPRCTRVYSTTNVFFFLLFFHVSSSGVWATPSVFLSMPSTSRPPPSKRGLGNPLGFVCLPLQAQGGGGGFGLGRPGPHRLSARTSGGWSVQRAH